MFVFELLKQLLLSRIRQVVDFHYHFIFRSRCFPSDRTMFDTLLTRITSPSSRRRHTYHCPEVHSDPEDLQPVTPRKPRLLERRKKGRRNVETGLRQARSLGRLDGLKEVGELLILVLFSICLRLLQRFFFDYHYKFSSSR